MDVALMAKDVIHVEKSRSWCNGTSTTLCGLTLTKVTTSGYWWTGTRITCPTCRNLNKS